MSRYKFKFGVERYSGLYLGAVFIIVFGLLKPDLFLTETTLHSVASQQAITAILGLAVMVPLAAGAFDLSIGATTNICAVVVVQMQTQNHYGMWLSIAIAVGTGFVIGVMNGFFVVKLRVNSFIATLGSATILDAVQQIITNQSTPSPPTSSTWLSLTQHNILGFQSIVLYVLVLAVFLWWVMAHTPVGRYFYASGGNPEAARLTGVRVDRWVWLSFIASGTLSGVAGILYASYIGASLNFGAALVLPAYAAAFLGSTQVKPGRFNVWGTIVAVYVLAIGIQGIQLLTSVQWLNSMFNGTVLVLAVAFATWRQTRSPAGRLFRRTLRRTAPPATGEEHPAASPPEPRSEDAHTSDRPAASQVGHRGMVKSPESDAELY